MDRRTFLKGFSLASAAGLSGCGLLNIDQYSVFLRSDIIDSPEREQEVLAKAKLGWTDDGQVRVAYLSGTPYERGYQHGALLRTEIQDNLTYLYESAVSKFHFKELFAEAFERARPYISEEQMDEMHGLAHGSKLPLDMVHHIHILPEIGEWGGTKHLKTVVKSMIDGSLGTSCSNFCTFGKATARGEFYTVRVLDWGLHRISKLHHYPLIAVHVPDYGYSFANIGWMGFIGAISGMNERGITLGEMGYGNPPGETLAGTPMAFLLRNVLLKADSLGDVREIISQSPGTNSYIFLMSDGKRKQAELYVRDRSRFVVFKPGQKLKDRNNDKDFPAIKDTVYGGHYQEKMTEALTANHGKITPDIIMRDIIPNIVMPSNFQDVVYDPVRLQFWVANAANTESRAADQPYTFFDLKKGLAEFRHTKA